MISIGTNFNYQGDYFLDGRQVVNEVEELRNWSKDIPYGFEVFCKRDCLWYVYLPNDIVHIGFLHREGDFVPRWEVEYYNADLPETFRVINKRIVPLETYIYDRMKLVVSDNASNSKGYYELGRSISPEVKYVLYDYKGNVTPKIYTEIIYGDFSRYSYQGDSSIFRPNIVLTDNMTFTVTSYAHDPNELSTYHTTGVLEYKFLPKSYLLISYLDTLESLDDAISILKETITDDMDLDATVDCRGYEIEGGVYIHYLVPKLIIDSCDLFEQTVDGIPMSAIEINDLTLTNDYGVDIEYWDVRLQYKQNEKININFKYNK